MPIRQRGAHAAARRALQEALLDQERLEHVLDRVALLADRRREVVDADRPAAELVEHRRSSLRSITSSPTRRRRASQRASATARVIAPSRAPRRSRARGAAAVDDARRAARAPRDLERAVGIDLDLEQPAERVTMRVSSSGV
jgi:hypothetical protein